VASSAGLSALTLPCGPGRLAIGHDGASHESVTTVPWRAPIRRVNYEGSGVLTVTCEYALTWAITAWRVAGRSLPIWCHTSVAKQQWSSNTLGRHGISVHRRERQDQVKTRPKNRTDKDCSASTETHLLIPRVQDIESARAAFPRSPPLTVARA